MGRLVEHLAPSYDADVAGLLDSANNAAAAALDPDRWSAVDVVIDFSHADAFLANLPRLCALRKDLVVGTTGWKDRQPEVRRAIEAAGISAVVAANFSVGANILEALAETAGHLFDPHASYGAFLHEAHHAAKRDAPSGTALAIKSAIEQGGFSRPIDVSSTRAGFIPGIHTAGFDGPSETVTLTHTVRDRATFAHGALAAAQWLYERGLHDSRVQGARGWFTMRDVLGLTRPPASTAVGQQQ
jgi:4-hydroxy-tetrahydrodipicolinate reductase